ncbi:hypothetical protein ACFVU3_13365 [Streptomyces sp. NPDC058052]|uniref:hypothetical protein n=1 Tax=Streptomyces sp. NPDC058052 TaxID=3346316 RepID=UPI0036E467F7
MNAVDSSTCSGETEEAVTGQVRTCLPAFDEVNVDPAADSAGQNADPEPQIVRGED